MTRCLMIEMDGPIYYYKAGEFTAQDGWRHKRMRHNADFEVIVGVRGSFELRIANEGNPTRTSVVMPTTCVVIPPESTIEGTGSTTGSVDFFWLHFFAQRYVSVDIPNSSVNIRPMTHAALLHVKRREFCPELNDVIVLPERFPLGNLNGIVLAIRNLLSCANSYRHSQRENDLLTQICLLEISDDYIEHVANALSPDVKTGHITEWIRSHMSADMNVASVARRFSMNPDYLTRLFRREQGIPLRTYLTNLRMETAKVLLIRTEYPITKVARYAYFNDPRNFMKQFRRFTGMTPSAYRSAFAHTHMNNPMIDPSIPLPQEVAISIENE